MKKIARGSVLAYSLILLSILLIVSIGMMSSSIVDLKSLSSNDNSVNAFQIADSGSQAIVASIKKDNSGNIGDLATRMGLSCSNGLVESSLLNGAYKVSFYGDASTAPLSCADTLSGVTSVKSVGSYRDSARAVSVAVAAGCSQPGVMVKVASNSDSANFSSGDYDKIRDYTRDVSNKIVGIHCNYSTAEALNFHYPIPAQFQVETFTASGFDSFYCSQSTGVCKFESSNCSSGWAVYGMCAE